MNLDIPVLHDGEKYGYTDKEEWREWYTDYIHKDVERMERRSASILSCGRFAPVCSIDTPLFTKCYLDFRPLLWYSVVLQGGAVMPKLLEELWYGNIYPSEQIKRNDPEIKDLIRQTAKNRDKLTDTLTEQQKELLEKYDDRMHELYAYSAMREQSHR